MDLSLLSFQMPDYPSVNIFIFREVTPLCKHTHSGLSWVMATEVINQRSSQVFI